MYDEPIDVFTASQSSFGYDLNDSLFNYERLRIYFVNNNGYKHIEDVKFSTTTTSTANGNALSFIGIPSTSGGTSIWLQSSSWGINDEGTRISSAISTQVRVGVSNSSQIHNMGIEKIIGFKY